MIKRSYSFNLRCNAPSGWRQKVAQFLVRLAHRIDGRHMLAVELLSTPAISEAAKFDVMPKGLALMRSNLEDETRMECVESVLHEECAELFEAEKGPRK